MIEWKKMKDERPKEEGEYLVYFSNEKFALDEWGEGVWTWSGYLPGDITHWAEINKPEERKEVMPREPCV